MGRLTSAIKDFASEAFKDSDSLQANNRQYYNSNNNGQNGYNMSYAQYPSNNINVQYPNNVHYAQSYPNSNNNGQYFNNLNNVSSYPVNNNGQYASNFNNPPQYQNNGNNGQYYNSTNGAQHVLNSSSEQCENRPNNQQNSYNINPNGQETNDSNSDGKKTAARGGFIEFGLPIILRYCLEDSIGLVWASVISTIPIILSMLYSIFVKKMFTPFSLIMIVSIYMDMVFQLSFKSERLQLLSGTVVSALVALFCLIAIPFNNKFVYYLAKPVATGGDHEKGIEFDAKWNLPQAKAISTRISIGVGVGFIIAAGVNAGVVFALPIGMINIASTIVSIGAAGVIGAWATWYKTRKTNQLLAAAQYQ